jgi:hypothetical protein
MRPLREILRSRTVLVFVLAVISILLWLATFRAIVAHSTLFVVLFGLTALCASLYTVLYAILTGGPKRKW